MKKEHRPTFLRNKTLIAHLNPILSNNKVDTKLCTTDIGHNTTTKQHGINTAQICRQTEKLFISCSVDRAPRYNRVKKNQLDAQPILSIFRQPPHVSSVSRPIIRGYNRMFTTTGTYYSF